MPVELEYIPMYRSPNINNNEPKDEGKKLLLKKLKDNKKSIEIVADLLKIM